jgi:ring-1,2-phenylacetyl-CoA epoxidase subunit PaaC
MNAQVKYYLEIADNALILSHRLSEFCSKAPFLEEDLANTNVALDLIGLAESVYGQVSEMTAAGGRAPGADHFAYNRGEHEFYNCLLAEQQNEDFAHIMVRQFFMDSYHYYFFMELSRSSDDFLAALALKSLKEVTYHLRRSSEWMIRLGDGTETASRKTDDAIHFLWQYTAELFDPSRADLEMQQNGKGVNLEKIKAMWSQKVNEICFFAKIKLPPVQPNVFRGKEGIHSEQLGHILTEMQYLVNKYPDALW